MKNDMPLLAKKLSRVYGIKVRILGPYIWKKNGRKLIDVKPKYSNEKDSPLCKTILLARAKLEVKIGRHLEDGEEVDHIDGDCLNDRTYNLQVLTRYENASKGSGRVKPKRIKCVWCETKFRPTKEQAKPSNKKKAGPFCSRKCSGQYGAALQNNKTSEISRKRIKVKRITGL